MLEHLQCPKCGASLNPEGRADLFCSYCGTRLKVQTGAAGSPMAMLDDIKEDTSLLAKQALITHLQSQIQEMEKEREQLVQKLQSIREAPPSHKTSALAWAIGIACVFGAIANISKSITNAFVYGVIGGICFLVFFTNSSRRNIENEEREAQVGELQRQIAALDGKIGEARQKIQDLKEEIDQIANGR